jgi:hypothetical protein
MGEPCQNDERTIMFQTHNSRNHAKHLVALVGLTTWLMLPGHSANRPELSDSLTKPALRIEPGQPASVSRLAPPEEATHARVKEAYGKLPLTSKPIEVRPMRG